MQSRLELIFKTKIGDNFRIFYNFKKLFCESGICLRIFEKVRDIEGFMLVVIEGHFTPRYGLGKPR